MKKQWKSFVSGMMVTLLLVGLIGSAVAASYQKQANLNYSGIKITLDGKAVTPTDAKGNSIDPFAIDGTTYLPVRGIANALGLDVEWDGATQTVKLAQAGSSNDVTFYDGFKVPMLENVVDCRYAQKSSIESGAIYKYSLTELPDIPPDSETSYFAEYFTLLASCGFEQIRTDESDPAFMHNKTLGLSVFIDVLAGGAFDSGYVAITIMPLE